MRPAIIESPYAGESEKNRKYGRALVRWALANGYAPFASHLLYTQPGVLRDWVPDERELGIRAGLSYIPIVPVTLVGLDRGISPGMQAGLEARAREGGEIIEVQLGGRWAQ